LLFDNIQHLLVAPKDPSVIVLSWSKFFFPVQLADLSKKELLARHYRTAKAVRCNSPRGRLVGCECASLTTTASAPSKTLPKQKRQKVRSFW
jgi:hypothetical protein